MIRLTVLYGHPKDPLEFDRYYREVHIPLARQMRGLKGWTVGKCQGIEANQKPPYYLIVGLYAESRAEMEAILGSPALIVGHEKTKIGVLIDDDRHRQLKGHIVVVSDGAVEAESLLN